MPNIFLFTWEEKLLLDQELKKWTKAFVSKYWGNSLYRFHTDDFSWEQILSLMMWWWLFDEKKFIIIYWMPKDTDKTNALTGKEYDKVWDFFISNFDTIDPETVIVLISYKPDKRGKLYKFLDKKVQKKVFWLLSEKKIIEYITSFLQCSESIWQLILEKCGTNLLYIHNEISKLKIIYDVSNKWNITRQDVDFYINTNEEVDNFKLLDYLNKDKKKAIKILDWIQRDWTDIFAIIWLLYWHIKIILQIIDQKNNWITDSKQIAAAIWIHPFIVYKILKYYDNYKNNEQNFLSLFDNLLNLDYWIKSWKVPAEFGYLELKKMIYSGNWVTIL